MMTYRPPLGPSRLPLNAVLNTERCCDKPPYTNLYYVEKRSNTIPLCPYHQRSWSQGQQVLGSVHRRSQVAGLDIGHLSKRQMLRGSPMGKFDALRGVL
jgi:hypothetical protein